MTTLALLAILATIALAGHVVVDVADSGIRIMLRLLARRAEARENARELRPTPEPRAAGGAVRGPLSPAETQRPRRHAL